MVGGAGTTAAGAPVVVGAGAVVAGRVGVVTSEWPAAKLIVGAVTAERGDPVKSTANVTMMAMPSMATTISLGNPLNRPNPGTCM